MDQGSWVNVWGQAAIQGCLQWGNTLAQKCCDWPPCSWLCKLLVWVVVGVFCLIPVITTYAILLAVVWVAMWVCIAWNWVRYTLWDKVRGGPTFLMMDGSVLMNECDDGDPTNHWWLYAPKGNDYLHGTWTQVADSQLARQGFAAAVLGDGRLVVLGGQWSDASGSVAEDQTNRCEVYDPVANVWKDFLGPPDVAHLGAAPSCMLPDGRLLVGDPNSTKVFALATPSLQWTPMAPKAKPSANEAWLLLPGGTVLAVPSSGVPPASEAYDSVNNLWTPLGDLASILTDGSGLMGPTVLLPDGRAIVIGNRDGRTAVFDRATQAALVSASPWLDGPVLQMSSGDFQGSVRGPAALLPGGGVLFPVERLAGAGPLAFCVADLALFPPVATVQGPSSIHCTTGMGRLLILGSGGVLWTQSDHWKMFVYHVPATPPAAWLPVVTSAPAQLVPGTPALVTGTLFNGVAQAVGQGCWNPSATNYPLVRVRHTASGKVRYCRTSHPRLQATGTLCMEVANPGQLVTVTVHVPSDLDPGPSVLNVVANGIASQGTPVLVQ